MSGLTLSNAQLRLAAILLVVVTLSALCVVYTSFKNRQLFIELQTLQNEATGQQIELGRLLLEESTWSSMAIIEQVATSELAMKVPAPEQVVVARQFVDKDARSITEKNIAQTALQIVQGDH